MLFITTNGSHVPTVPFGGFLRRPLLRHAIRPIAAFATVVLAGVVGFTVLGDVGVVDALFWLLDPTSIELHFQEHDGPATLVKGYAVVVLTGLVVSGLWTGETVLAAAFGGRIRDELRQMQIESTIDDLDDHVVVCGYGTFGKTVARSLRDAGRDVVVVESQDAQFDRAVEDGVLAVQGDARREDSLDAAGVDRASSLVGAIDDSNVNIQIVLSASQTAPTVRLVVGVGDAMYESLARRAGADEVIIPEVVSGEQVTNGL